MPDDAKHEQERDGERLQLEPRDGQQVSRAGPREGIVDLGLDSFALAQQQRGGQRSDRRIELLEQPRGSRTGFVPSKPPSARVRLPRLVAPEALRIVDREAQANSLGSHEMRDSRIRPD